MQFGEYLKELREKRNLLQRELAASVNMDVAYLSKIERGNRAARKEQVIAFARELKVSEQEMLIQWNSQNIIDTLKDEKNSTEILKIAEKELKNITKKSK